MTGICAGTRAAAAAGGLTTDESAWMAWDGSNDGAPAVVVTNANNTVNGGVHVEFSDEANDEAVVVYSNAGTQLGGVAMIIDYVADTINGGTAADLGGGGVSIKGMETLTTARDVLSITETNAQIIRVSGTNTVNNQDTENVRPTGNGVSAYCKYDDDAFMALGVDNSGNLFSRDFTVSAGVITVNAATDTTFNASGADNNHDVVCFPLSTTRVLAFVMDNSDAAGTVDAVLLTKSGSTWVNTGADNLLDISGGGILFDSDGAAPSQIGFDGQSGQDTSAAIPLKAATRIHSSAVQVTDGDFTYCATHVYAEGNASTNARSFLLGVKWDSTAADADALTKFIPSAFSISELSISEIHTYDSRFAMTSTNSSTTFSAYMALQSKGGFLWKIRHSAAGNRYSLQPTKIIVNGDVIHGRTQAVINVQDGATDPTHPNLAVALKSDLSEGIVVGLQLSSATVGELFAETMVQ